MPQASTDPTYPALPRAWKKLSVAERSAVYSLRAKWRRTHDSERYKKFSRRVVSLRKALGLTQMQFARQMGLNWRTIIRWERAEGHLPGRLVLLRLKELEELNEALVRQRRKGDLR